MTPVVAAIGRLNITGNVTPHVWYRRSEFRSEANRPDRNMITAVADILYWYRPSEVRDEERGGLVVGYERKFQREMLQYNYERRAAVFGMSEREMREACNRAQKAGLIRIEYRTERVQGRLLHNVVYVEPIPEAIAVTLQGPDVDPGVKAKGAKRERHVQAGMADEPLTEDTGVADQGESVLAPAPESTSRNSGGFSFGGGQESTSRNFARSTSQNPGGDLPKFRDIYHETSPEISCPREGGVFQLEDDAREQRDACQAAEPSPGPHTTTASGEGTADTTLKAQREPGTSVAVLPPAGRAADIAITDADLALLFGPAEGGQEAATVPEVPQVAAPATVDALVPVPPAELAGRPRATAGNPSYRRVVGMVGGKRAVEAGLLDELTPSGALSRRDWLRLTEAELDLVRMTAQVEARASGANFQTLAIRGLDRLIGAPTRTKGGGAGSVVTLPGAYLTREEKEAQAAQFSVVEAGQQWQGRESGKLYTVMEVTSQSVLIQELGEYPFQKFHKLFQWPEG